MALQQRWTALVATGLVAGALLACKKKPDAATEASAAASAPAAPATTAAPAATSAAPAATEAPAAPNEAKLGDVKRYGVDKESKLDDSGVRVTADELKVYNEADTSTDDVATLPKGLLVFRQVKMDAFTLVEFPSGVGQFSQGWVETKSLSETAEKVSRAGALSEKKTATVKIVDGGTAAATDGGKTDAGSADKQAADSKAAADKAAADKKAADKKAADAKEAADKAAADKKAADKKAEDAKEAADKKAADKKAADKKAAADKRKAAAEKAK